MAQCMGQITGLGSTLHSRYPVAATLLRNHGISKLDGCLSCKKWRQIVEFRSAHGGVCQFSGPFFIGYIGLHLIRALEMLSAVRAQASRDDDQGTSQYGLGGRGAIFGFGNFQERFVGRFAMVGFVAAVVMEVVTGKGVFGQLGIDPLRIRYPFLLGFTFLLVAGLLGGYVVIKNPPDVSKAPPNEGAGIPRDPLKTFDANNLETMTTYTRGGVVERPSGQKGREPYVSDLELPTKKDE